MKTWHVWTGASTFTGLVLIGQLSSYPAIASGIHSLMWFVGVLILLVGGVWALTAMAKGRGVYFRWQHDGLKAMLVPASILAPVLIAFVVGALVIGG